MKENDNEDEDDSDPMKEFLAWDKHRATIIKYITAILKNGGYYYSY